MTTDTELKKSAKPVFDRRRVGNESYQDYKARMESTDPERIAERHKYARMLLEIRLTADKRSDSKEKVRFFKDHVKTGLGSIPYDKVTAYVSGLDWIELPVQHRLPALEILSLEQMNVPGGVLYRVTEHSQGYEPDWVFLNVKHAIGRARPEPIQWAARVL